MTLDSPHRQIASAETTDPEWIRGIHRLWKIAQDRRIRRHSKGMGRVDSAWRRHP